MPLLGAQHLLVVLALSIVVGDVELQGKARQT